MGKRTNLIITLLVAVLLLGVLGQIRADPATSQANCPASSTERHSSSVWKATGRSTSPRCPGKSRWRAYSPHS
ncbi:MAG: hypothetical protein HC809_08700 [Gammaproteobacteria bacterium]|nr:hypothetical protein [Gammaproteobacteria bacterium]